MARQREFDRSETLHRAQAVFWQKGYAATSTADLLDAMQIGRQSMYDTFGDKRSLYLEALRQYCEDSTADLLRHLQGGTPLQAVANMLTAFASRPARENARGCMGVNAVCEFGNSDADINALQAYYGNRVNGAVEQMLRAALKAGEIPAGTDVRQAAAFVAATLSGMKVSAKAGAGVAALKHIAHFAIKALQAG